MTSEADKPTGDQTNIDTAGGPAILSGQFQQSPIITGTVQGDVISAQTIYYHPPATPLDSQQQRNRRAMLAKVKAIWIEGLLQQSLAKELRIALDLIDQPDAVDLPLNALVQELNRPSRPLPAGTPIIQ